MSADASRLSLLCLGTGRGATAVYDGYASSSAALLVDGEPVLLVDAGFGVVRACKAAFGAVPRTLLITHNHSDHAAELPVILAAECARDRRLRVIAAAEVATTLRAHRLHELHSTGAPPSAFADWQDVAPDTPIALTDTLSLRLLRARHSEPCYGFIVEANGKPLLAYGGDSACDADYYDRLWAAPHVVLDARSRANAEHASFTQVAAYTAERPTRDLHITGYGRPEQAPAELTPLRPGECIDLNGNPGT